jgi:4-alpha-glucanotransferase
LKIVGTAVPLWSLKSRRPGAGDEVSGTFETGRRFLTWLTATGQGAWLFLPPYKGYGVGLDPRYLSPVDSTREPSAGSLIKFRREHASWLSDHALFCALRDRFGTDEWTTWESGTRLRKPEAMRHWRRELKEEIAGHILLQWRLHAGYSELRAEARRQGIRILGDLPFYLPLQSPLVWAHRDCFDLGADGRPKRVSGVPNGPLAHFGRQVWGHPLYAWNRRAAWPGIASFWRLRIRYHAKLYDLMRLDHAKGLFSYGAMDVHDQSRDKILKGPGAPLLGQVIRGARQNGLTLFAEDAGDRLEALRAELFKLHVPGIRILRFAYNEKKKTVESEYADPANYREDAIAFTSTHDTEPLMAYLRLLTVEEKRHLCDHVRVEYSGDDALLAARLRGAVTASPARYSIIPIQDWLLTKDRINVPGTERPKGDVNWRYRLATAVEDLPLLHVSSHNERRASRSTGSGTGPKR